MLFYVNEAGSPRCEACDITFHVVLDLEVHNGGEHRDVWCVPCKRFFQSEGNLRMVRSLGPNRWKLTSYTLQHARSSVHNKSYSPVLHEKCKRLFLSGADVVQHLESGHCVSRITRPLIDKYIAENDLQGAITDSNRLLITAKGKRIYKPPPVVKADRSDLDRIDGVVRWQCPLCEVHVADKDRLNQHLISPKHYTGSNLYRCAHLPCGKEFPALSCLLAHIRDGSCGARQARETMDALNELAAGLATVRLTGK